MATNNKINSINKSINISRAKPRTLEHTKFDLLQEIENFLSVNLEDVKIHDFRIDRETIIGGVRFEEYLIETIIKKYFPVSFDSLVNWIKEEPLLINNPDEDEEDNVARILEENTVNYLRRYVLRKLDENGVYDVKRMEVE